MARIGRSPEVAEAYTRPTPKVTLFMITNIPNTIGYYRDRIRITELSIQSMLSAVNKERRYYDFLVWDNGSGVEWRDRLTKMQADGVITRLVLSDNVGKLSALRAGMSMVDSEYISYTDDDVLFYPEWLTKEIEVLEGVPSTISVGGSPIRSLFNHFTKQVDRFRINENFKIEQGTDLLPRQWVIDDALCRGLTIEQYDKVHGEDVQTLVTYKNGIKFWAHGHHMQFTGKREPLLKRLPEGRELMGRMREWNNLIQDTTGYAQLTTYDRVCRHMGNVMDQQIVDDALEMELVL